MMSRDARGAPPTGQVSYIANDLEPETITSTTMASNTVTKISHAFSLSRKEGMDEKHMY
jgi:hypothetical protein